MAAGVLVAAAVALAAGTADAAPVGAWAAVGTAVGVGVVVAQAASKIVVITLTIIKRFGRMSKPSFMASSRRRGDGSLSAKLGDLIGARRTRAGARRYPRRQNSH